eukprot:8794088-Pyramimonas_sp.AAC.1
MPHGALTTLSIQARLRPRLCRSSASHKMAASPTMAREVQLSTMNLPSSSSTKVSLVEAHC